MADQVTPREILKSYPLFKVATQKKPGDEIIIREVRCKDRGELEGFMRRLSNVATISELNVYEVHEVKKDGTISVLIGDNRAWHGRVRKMDGVMVPKIPREETPPPAEIAQLGTPIIPLPAPKPEEKKGTVIGRLIGMVNPPAKEEEVKGPNELGRPVRLYDYKVA